MEGIAGRRKRGDSLSDPGVMFVVTLSFYLGLEFCLVIVRTWKCVTPHLQGPWPETIWYRSTTAQSLLCFSCSESTTWLRRETGKQTRR